MGDQTDEEAGGEVKLPLSGLSRGPSPKRRIRGQMPPQMLLFPQTKESISMFSGINTEPWGTKQKWGWGYHICR